MITCQKCGAPFSTLSVPDTFLPPHDCVPAETELPFQTFARMTGLDWPGGRSNTVLALLKIFRIVERPGSAEANLALQTKLLTV